MNAHRDPDRMVNAFLSEGPTELADQVYDAVRTTIEHRRQRVVIGPWRKPVMNKFVSIGLGAAAVVVVALIGAQLLGPQGPTGPGAGPSATASPTAEPSVEPSPSADGSLPEGPITVDLPGGMQMTVSIPATGWSGAGGILVKNDHVDPPDGAGKIVFVGGGWAVPGDPCSWDTTMPDDVATTVDELVTALAAQATRNASAPADITLDGHAGKAITLHVPDDAVFGACDEEQFCTLAAPDRTPAETCERYHQGPGQIDNLWILDVNGELVVIDWTYYEGTPDEYVAELEAIVESTTFE